MSELNEQIKTFNDLDAYIGPEFNQVFNSTDADISIYSSTQEVDYLGNVKVPNNLLDKVSLNLVMLVPKNTPLEIRDKIALSNKNQLG